MKLRIDQLKINKIKLIIIIQMIVIIVKLQLNLLNNLPYNN